MLKAKKYLSDNTYYTSMIFLVSLLLAYRQDKHMSDIRDLIDKTIIASLHTREIIVDK